MLTPHQTHYCLRASEDLSLEASPMAVQDALVLSNSPVPLLSNSFNMDSSIPHPHSLPLSGGCLGEEHLRPDPSETTAPRDHHREPQLTRAYSASGAGGGSLSSHSSHSHSSSSSISSRLQYWRAATANSASQQQQRHHSQGRAPNRARPSTSHSSGIPPYVPRLATSRSLLTPEERNAADACLPQAEICLAPDDVAHCDKAALEGRSLGLLLHNRLTLDADVKPGEDDVAMESEMLDVSKLEEREGANPLCSRSVVPFEEDIKFPRQTENPLPSSVACRGSSACHRTSSAYPSSGCPPSVPTLLRTASNASTQSSSCPPLPSTSTPTRPYGLYNSVNGGSLSRAMLPPLSSSPVSPPVTGQRAGSSARMGEFSQSARMGEFKIGKSTECSPSPLKAADRGLLPHLGLSTGAAYGGLRTQSARMGDICLGRLEASYDGCTSESERQRLADAYAVLPLERYHSLQDGDVSGKAAERHRTHSFGGPAAYQMSQSPLGVSPFGSSPSPLKNNVFEWAARARMDAKVNLSRRSSV